MTVATLDTMTDAELDARLVRLYRQHLAASQGQRSQWHDMIQETLAEISRRTHVALGLTCQPSVSV